MLKSRCRQPRPQDGNATQRWDQSRQSNWQLQFNAADRRLGRVNICHAAFVLNRRQRRTRLMFGHALRAFSSQRSHRHIASTLLRFSRRRPDPATFVNEFFSSSEDRDGSDDNGVRTNPYPLTGASSHMIQHPAFTVEPWCLRETELDLDVLAASPCSHRPTGILAGGAISMKEIRTASRVLI